MNGFQHQNQQQQQQPTTSTGSPGPAYQFQRSNSSYDDTNRSLDYTLSSGNNNFYYENNNVHNDNGNGNSNNSYGNGYGDDSASDSYTALDITGGASSLTGLVHNDYHYHNNSHHNNSSSTASPQDATDTVREMHLALLYLLSNPEEFQRALQLHPRQGTTTLAEWNAEYYDTESMTDAGGSTVFNSNNNNNSNSDSHGYGNGNNGDGCVNGNNTTTNNNNNGNGGGSSESMISFNTTSTTTATTNAPTPLPFVVFADDAEVVLPQAHTASQLFGLERIEGIELEAAAGIPSLSQLFLRWLALMPGGDHLNLIDPPGLTVMRIAGGRYRVTAAHRVVWTWMNEFASLAEAHGHDEVEKLQTGDLVTMTIVDVFETDNQGKLLSYCPTFDNRAVHKTNPATETIRKSSSKLMTLVGKVHNSKAAKGFYTRARLVAFSMKHKMDEAAANYTASPVRRRTPNSDVGSSVTEFEEALNAAESAAVGVGSSSPSAEKEKEEEEEEELVKASNSGSDTTLQDADPTKNMENKCIPSTEKPRQQIHDNNPALSQMEEEQRQTTNTRSEAYLSDDEAATEDDEI